VSARVASRKLKTKTKNFSELQMRVYNEIRKPLRSAHSAQAATGNYPHRALKAKRGLCLFLNNKIFVLPLPRDSLTLTAAA
jgi:hypothetical protein